MFTMDTTMGEILDIPAVKAFLEKAAPQMISGPAAGYITPMTLSALKGMSPESAPMVDALLAIANGKNIDASAFDPSKQKAVVKCGPTVAQYDLDDVDGKMYMLDHRFSGAFIVQFSKKMDENIPGQITYEGTPVDYVLTTAQVAGGVQLLGIYVRNICTEYGTDYTFHFEGFTDTDGNVIDPQDFTVRTIDKAIPDPAYAAHEAVAQRAAEEGMVLLKNENHLLPLKKDAHVHLIGAEEFRTGAVGAGKINPRYQIRFLEAVKDSAFVIDDNSDTSIIVISRASGENFDNTPYKGQYYLTDAEEKMITEAKEKSKHIIAIINSGYPMDVRWTLDTSIEAVIWTGFSGMLGGPALVNILNGSINPSGKLPDTWALDYKDIPASANFYVPPSVEDAIGADEDIWIDTVYEEDIYVGYRYFETFDKPVAYPFGHGLSYTTFSTEGKLTDSDIKNVQMEVSVTNTGNSAGKEVLQVYVAIPDGNLEQPSKRLIAFHKTDLLEAGKTETTTLSIPIDNLTSYDEKAHAFILEKGTYIFFLGDSIKQVEPIGSIEVGENRTVKIVGNYMKPPIDFTRLSKFDETTYPQGKLSGIIPDQHSLHHKTDRSHIDEVELLEDPLIDTFSTEELARLSICASSGWGMQDIGVAGRINRLGERNLPYFAVSDGNNGVNINKPNIGMPTSNLICASWNPSLAYEVAKVIAEEARENNVQMILAPAMNLHRNPLCGRQPEYFSEDPLLGGIMAGFHSLGLEENGMASSIKHVCCNGSESSRKRNHSIVSQRALRELYLRTFEVAFSVCKPDSIMTAYNAVNGVQASEDEELLMGIFRHEFGLEGYIMTDWGCYDTADVAKMVQAGVCWITPGSTDDTYVTPILDGIKNGTVDEKRLRNNVKYMYHVIRKRTEK